MQSLITSHTNDSVVKRADAAKSVRCMLNAEGPQCYGVVSGCHRGLVVAGYAWSGGTGNKIDAVEVSLDDGVTWTPAALMDGVPDAASGKHWAWRRWEFAVPTAVSTDATSTISTLRCRVKRTRCLALQL